MIRRWREFSSLRNYSALVYSQFGDPVKVLSLQDHSSKQDRELSPHELRLKMLAATINPADLNTIEGVYPLKPTDPEWKLPAVAGHEGVGEVIEIGAKVTGLKPGDWVVPVTSHQGTWCERGIFQNQNWHKISNQIPVSSAAALAINPPTALCLMRLFVDLKEGDVVVQNGATSAVGQSIIQLSKMKGIHTFNIIRNRPELDKTKEYLFSLGASFVETEESAIEAFRKSGLSQASLGLNCIGGKSVILLGKLLKKSAVLVTYGGMSKQPLLIPTSMFIFKDLTFRGFWWSGNTSDQLGIDAKKTIIDEIGSYLKSGELKIKTEAYELRDYKGALQRHNESFRTSKIILTL